MPRHRLAILVLLSAALWPLPAAAQTVDTVLGPALDLTHPFDADTIYWPTEEGFVLEVEKAGITEAGYWYASNRMRLAEHGGTHMDAPYHFHESGSRADQVSLSRLIAPARVVDVREACAADRDHGVSVADLERFEAAHGRIPDGAAVLLLTGWSARWPDRLRYLGTDEHGEAAVAKLHFPGLDPAAARWLVAKRKVAAVGLDTASIDPGQSTLFESHRTLFAAEIPAFENLANLDRLPASGAILIALPMKIAGGTGGPLRAVAILPTTR